LQQLHLASFLSFTPTHTPHIYPLPYTTLFRSPLIGPDAQSLLEERNRQIWAPRAAGARFGQENRPEAVRDVEQRIEGRGQVEQRSEEHTSELQSPYDLVCRLLLEKKKKNNKRN